MNDLKKAQYILGNKKIKATEIENITGITRVTVYKYRKKNNENIGSMRYSTVIKLAKMYDDSVQSDREDEDYNQFVARLFLDIDELIHIQREKDAENDKYDIADVLDNLREELRYEKPLLRGLFRKYVLSDE